LALLEQLKAPDRAVLWEALSKARPFHFNAALLREWTQRCRLAQTSDIHSVVDRLLATPHSRLGADDLAAYHELEQLVGDHDHRSRGPHELALAFARAATRLLEHFGPDDQPRALVRSRARWLRRSEPSWRASMIKTVRDFIVGTAQ
jgi:hypothetical protein